jgi:uncharacterized membrane protein
MPGFAKARSTRFHNFNLHTKGIIMPETKSSGFADNTIAALAYVTFIPAVAFLILKPYNRSPYIRFHAWQSIFLSCVLYIFVTGLNWTTSFVLTLGVFPYLVAARIIWIIWGLLWLLCAVRALNGHLFKLPLIGKLAEKQAAD